MMFLITAHTQTKTDIENWSQDMQVLKGWNLERQGSSFN